LQQKHIAVVEYCSSCREYRGDIPTGGVILQHCIRDDIPFPKREILFIGISKASRQGEQSQGEFRQGEHPQGVNYPFSLKSKGGEIVKLMW
jgi:hypothetical protein